MSNMDNAANMIKCLTWSEMIEFASELNDVMEEINDGVGIGGIGCVGVDQTYKICEMLNGWAETRA